MQTDSTLSLGKFLCEKLNHNRKRWKNSRQIFGNLVVNSAQISAHKYLIKTFHENILKIAKIWCFSFLRSNMPLYNTGLGWLWITLLCRRPEKKMEENRSEGPLLNAVCELTNVGTMHEAWLL